MKPVEEFTHYLLVIKYLAVYAFYHHRDQVRIFETEVLTFYLPLSYFLEFFLLNVNNFL